MEKKYYKYKPENLLVISKIVTIHYFELDRDFHSRGEVHDFWEMLYVAKGNLLCTANEETFTLQEGEAVFHRPGEFHQHMTDGKTAPNLFIISFECKNEAIRFFEGKRIALDHSQLRLVRWILEESQKTFRVANATPDTKRMPLQQSPAPGGLQLIKNYLEILLIRLLRGAGDAQESAAIFLTESEFDGHISKQIINYMKSNLYKRLTIEEICKELNYNKSYIFQRFKADTGYPIMAYFLKLKIEQAKRMLREGEAAVSQIAEALAFDTPNYFSKTFKKHTGMSPLTYRRIHKK